MNEWTDEFISHAQVELVSMVKDWKYDYGADDKECIAMLSWMILKINPACSLDFDSIGKRADVEDECNVGFCKDGCESFCDDWVFRPFSRV